MGMIARKKVYIIGVAAFVLVAAGVLLGILLFGGRSLPEEIQPLVFPVMGDGMDLSAYTFEGDYKALEGQIGQETALIYYDPASVSLDRLKKNLQIPEVGTSDGTGGVTYTTDECRLNVSANGIFNVTFKNVEESVEAVRVSDKKYIEEASAFLKQHDLLDEGFRVNTELACDRLVGPEGETIVGKTVGFFPVTEQGKVYGNARIAVHMNADGEVLDVYYNYLRYNKTVEASLISVKEAYKQATENTGDNMLLNLPENSRSTLKFEKVELNYYEVVTDPEVPATRQPVYTFTGTNQEGEAFAITVPAVDY